MRRWTRILVIVVLVATGALALLWTQQRRLIYFPAPGPVPSATAVWSGARDVVVRTADGVDLGAWFFPAAERGPAAVVFNGNGGDRSMRAALALALRRTGLSVLLFDYRGFGGNPGRPSEEGLAADARAARDWLAAQPEVDPGRLVYFGESLGGAVAVRLAVERPPAALILRSPFTSLPDVGAVHYPWLPVRRLLIDRYPSIDRIAGVDAPLLVIAGDRDDIVPIGLSRRLFGAAAEPKEFVLVPGAGHNDRALLDGRRMLDAIERFLGRTSVLD
ncbi:alpha/beta hydrolase [Mycolicibacterium baixiangningiae]|uniref:alpha/beta hydrolase n=1 Tax=Mycolicibacterium baixiangningiae TaxID=2761578 RepID=UPI0018D1F402|nr:alpha/beta hydrolase [Mycolicibacterium baixiangningiae]